MSVYINCIRYHFQEYSNDWSDDDFSDDSEDHDSDSEDNGAVTSKADDDDDSGSNI